MNKKSSDKKTIEQYDHKGEKRLNNPPIGLVTAETDKETTKKVYAYDPHIDPSLQFDSYSSEIEKIINNGLEANSIEETKEALFELKKRREPYLNWAGKAEHTTFEVPIVSLHVHERIDPLSIIESVRKKDKSKFFQPSLFEASEENPPFNQAIEFYKHPHGWSNRLIAGDSLLVMNSLLEKEGMAGKVQMIYIDPPYGIKYGSNFQPFVNKRDVKDEKDEDLTQEPETIKAFRDTWELGIHSYLTYLRDRLLLAHELLTESGSVFVQISDKNIHHVRELMDEVFSAENFVNVISFQTTSGLASKYLKGVYDFIIWYAKKKKNLKYNQLFIEKGVGLETYYDKVELPDGRISSGPREELLDIPKGSRYLTYQPLLSGAYSESTTFEYEFNDRRFHPGSNRCWKTTRQGLDNLARAKRIYPSENTLKFIRYFDDFPVTEISNFWNDTMELVGKYYVVQTGPKVISRCLLMTTDPGDLVFDPTCGSGTTAYVAEQWGRRWITCDTSRVAITLAKQRLMTALFDYYELAHPKEGIKSGFKYKTVPHITLKSIANNEEIDLIYNQYHPSIEKALQEFNTINGLSLKEWEIPFEWNKIWKDQSKAYFELFWKLKREMQQKMDESIQNRADQETLYDQPFIDKKKIRVSGPFTVEAVPSSTVKPLYEIDQEQSVDESIVRSGETLRQSQWRDELFKTGIRGKSGQKIEFSRVETLSGTRWLHALAETKEDNPEKVVVSFGPEYAPLDKKQVELAIEEALLLVPKPKIIIFATFQFDPEAARVIDQTIWPGTTLLKVQMNTDLFTEDLKKKRSSNESFMLIGQPDIQVTKIKDGENQGKYQIEVLGFDYYNPLTGNIESGGTEKIAMWMLDPDYDGRSLFPKQVFFPMAGENEGWSKLSKNLKAEIDEDLIEAYRGTISLPFTPGDYHRIAVKIVDDRGIESLKIIEVE